MILPNSLDEGGSHEAAGDEFDNGAEKNTDETTPACAKCSREGLGGELTFGYGRYEFKQDSAYQRSKDDA